MIGDLPDLAIGDQCADSDEAAITGRQVGAQPEIAEQYLGGVVLQPGGGSAELLADDFDPLGLRCFIQRQSFGVAEGRALAPILRWAKTLRVIVVAASALPRPA